MRIILILGILLSVAIVIWLAPDAYSFWKLHDPALTAQLNTDLRSTITDCLVQKVASHSQSWEVFCAYKVIGAERLKIEAPNTEWTQHPKIIPSGFAKASAYA